MYLWFNYIKNGVYFTANPGKKNQVIIDLLEFALHIKYNKKKLHS